MNPINCFPLQAGDLVNPTRKSLFSQRMLDKKESLYASRKNAPLGNAIKSPPLFIGEIGLLSPPPTTQWLNHAEKSHNLSDIVSGRLD